MKLLIAAALALGAYAPALAQAPPPSESVVVARGEATVKRAPDRAWVTISAESRSRTSREAQRANADAMSAVVSRLKSAGVAGDALRTTAIDLQPEFDFANGRQTLRGYVARNSVEARVDDLPKLGDVLDAAVSAGATSIAGVRFDLRERAAAEREALQKAVEDARARANAAAAGAGLRVDRVVRIEEQGAIEMPGPRPMVTTLRAGAAADAVTPVAPGELEIRAAVTLTASVR